MSCRHCLWADLGQRSSVHGAGMGQGAGARLSPHCLLSARLMPCTELHSGRAAVGQRRAGHRHLDLTQSPNQIWVQCDALKANTVVSVGFQREKHAGQSRVANPLLGGTCERASMTQPGANGFQRGSWHPTALRCAHRQNRRKEVT